MKTSYLDLILKNTPRLFTAINQNEFSVNFGCLERDFWHYKIEKDFPSSIWQTGALALALLFQTRFPGNIYFGQEKVLRLTQAAIAFWTKIQQSDGSFSEWYPYERSFVATAFTTYAVSETLLLLKNRSLLPQKTTFEALDKACQWLINHPESGVSNHNAGAVLALYNFSLLSGKKIFREAAQKSLTKLLETQSEEGWFPEYGGADLGYLSLTIDFLAKYWQKTKDERVFSSLKKAVSFLSYFIHPDGSFGGEYGSRGTKFLVPCGLEVLASHLPEAGAILANWVPFDSFDDRYLIFFFLGNWLQAHLESQKSKVKSQKLNQFDKSFPEAGIRVVKSKNYYLVVSYKKNGVIKVFKDDRLVFSDTGWWGRLKDGRIVSSQWLNPSQESFLIQTHFCQVPEPFLGSKMILFRLFNYTLGRISWVSILYQWWLKKKYITSVRPVSVFLKRSLQFKRRRVFLEDEISSGEGVFLLSLKPTTNLCQKFTPTSLFFTPQDLLAEDGRDYAMLLNKKRKIKIRRAI